VSNIRPIRGPRPEVFPDNVDPEATTGLVLWLPSQDAKRLAVLARDHGDSLADALSRVITSAFRARVGR